MTALFGEFNRSGLLMLGDFGRLQIAVMLAAAVVVCTLTWLDLRDLTQRRRATLVALRAFALLLAIAALLEPALELRHVTVVPNRVAVLVDTSESQSLPVSPGVTRHDRAVAALEALRPTLEAGSADHVFEVHTFDGSSAATSIAAVGALGPPSGAATHLLESMRTVVDRVGARDIGGFVIISDGIDNGELAGRVGRGAPLDDETLAFINALEAPIHTIATAREGELRDVAIRRVVRDDFAFVRNAVSVVVELEVLGFSDETLNVSLRRGTELLQTRQVPLVTGTTSYRVEFEFVPELIGKEIYVVDTPVLDGEALTENNRELFVLRVIRDKIRALLVVGRPSWDVRFMRQMLRNNPNVDLISFFILRTQDDVQRVRDTEMSLIPFPTDELFNEQLGGFDLVIFQNFDFGPYNMRQYLPRIREYVRGGGGFLMIGGDLSLASGGYAATEIADVLPVRLPPGGGDDRIDLRPFRPELTEAGQRHPITRLAFDAVDNRRLWETLPQMRGTNRVLEAREGATVLATHPHLQASGAPMPTIAVADIEDGRSMVVTYDSAWRWNFEHTGRGGASSPYTAFWNSAIRWLIRDPALNLVDVELPRDIEAPGETVEGVIRVFRPDYGPAIDTAGTLTIVRRPLDDLKADPETVIERPFVTDARGQHGIRIVLEEPGVFEVRAEVPQPDGAVLRDTEVLLSVRRDVELREVEPRPALLAALSEASGGRAYVADERPRGLEFRAARVEEVNRRQVVSLWSAPWTLAVFLALLGSEWGLRRRWGRA